MQNSATPVITSHDQSMGASVAATEPPMIMHASDVMLIFGSASRQNPSHVRER